MLPICPLPQAACRSLSRCLDFSKIYLAAVCIEPDVRRLSPKMFFFLLFFAIDGAVQLLLLTGIRLEDLIDG